MSLAACQMHKMDVMICKLLSLIMSMPNIRMRDLGGSLPLPSQALIPSDKPDQRTPASTVPGVMDLTKTSSTTITTDHSSLRVGLPKKIDDDHHQWKRVDSFTPDAIARQQMMLSSDLCLAYQHNSEHDACVDEQMLTEGMTLGKANKNCRNLQKNGGFLNAKDTHCCAWTNTKALYNQRVLQKSVAGDYCGIDITEPMNFTAGRNQCCLLENDDADLQSEGDCDSSKWPKGPAFNAVIDFAESEKAWLRFYTMAWWTATENGFDDLERVSMVEKRKSKKDAARKKRMRNMKNKKNGKNKGNKNKDEDEDSDDAADVATVVKAAASTVEDEAKTEKKTRTKVSTTRRTSNRDSFKSRGKGRK